jgi:hypothetical protein
LLYRARLSGREALLYVLFEHQRKAEALVVLRVLRYMVRALEEHVRRVGDALPLPVVLPIVLHHSDSGWTAPTHLHGLFDPELLAVPGIRELVPEFRFLLDDISRVSNAELRRRVAGGGPEFVSVVLWAMRAGRQAHVAEELLEWVESLRRIFEANHPEDAFAEILRYLCRVNENLTPRDLIAVGSRHDTCRTMDRRRKG